MSEMKHDESLERDHRKSSHVSIWYIVGGAALVLVAAGVLTSLHDIRRYLRIRSM
ncbi:MAG TPA: hypothetical protein VGC91_20355 [Pyrinomonadaceae bacterium]|jgi:hypothetical protein